MTACSSHSKAGINDHELFLEENKKNEALTEEVEQLPQKKYVGDTKVKDLKKTKKEEKAA